MIIKTYFKKWGNNKTSEVCIIRCDNPYCKKEFERLKVLTEKSVGKLYCCRSCQVTGKNLDKGVDKLHKKGYKVIFVGHDYESAKCGKMLEHRYIMEQYLGRPLTNEESIHHKNGNKTDNRIENLELWSKYQPAGQRVRDKIVWAKEILKLYGIDENEY